MAPNIYQFKITLRGSRPKVWRRIQVPQQYNFSDLHLAIQDAMGWFNCHMHQFEVINPNTKKVDTIGIPVMLDETIPENTVKIAQYFLNSGDGANYEYDFGDGWEHDIVLEKILPAIMGMKYPICIDGKMACPPEDCGGVCGYKGLVKILANPQHNEYAEYIVWLERLGRHNFNPRYFNAKLVNFRKSTVLWKLAFAGQGASAQFNMASNVYQFKITLKGKKPKIWRRIQVPEKYNFWDLHVAIQDAMGWLDCHLHQFEMFNPNTGKMVTIGIPDNDGIAYPNTFTIPEKNVKIAQYFVYSGDEAIYEYDFGDRWEHEIVLEKILPAIVGKQYPQCIDGGMACPPEDCGGICGYKDLLKIMANPQHKEYAERMQWLKKIGKINFNSVYFNSKLIKFHNPEERWEIAFANQGTSGQLHMASNIYQFKITLKGKKPKIWRRIQVPEKYNFWDFHVAIQDAMGWLDCHLHQFEMFNPYTREMVTIGMPDNDGFAFPFDSTITIPEKTVKIAQYFVYSGDKANYEYDFGDCWQHEIVLEKILPAIVGKKYPQCIDGAMACPPEDCGGVYGYKDLLKILANPRHKEYTERMEWLEIIGRINFDPLNFNPKLINFHNPEKRWKIAFHSEY